MMRLLISTLCISMLLISCSTGKKAYERGDYYTATLKAVNRLRSDPDSEKAIDALKNSYPMALKYYQGRIDNALASGSQFKQSEIVDYYERMHDMGDEISRCPAALELFPNVSLYTKELTQSRELAAEEHYAAAKEKEKINTRNSWKEAYYHYEMADCFIPGYKDVELAMDQAKYYATWKVIVEKIPVPRAYEITSEFFLNQVIEALENNRPNEFVAYYSPETAEKAGIKYPDQVLRMNFDEFVIGNIYDRETTIEVSRDSVEVGTVTLSGGKVQKVYGTVKARLTTYRREVISHGVLDVTIVDFQLSKVATQRKFPGQFTWFNEWSTFNGDERALSREQLESCNRKPIPPPPPQALFVEFTKPIYSQVTPYLQSFFRNY